MSVTKFLDSAGLTYLWSKLKTYFDNLGARTTSTTLSVSIQNWATDTTSQSGETLYKKQVVVNHVYIDKPTVDIGSSGILPTVAEQTAYDLLQYATIDKTVPCLYLYSSAIPVSAYYIDVMGVD